jgi:hypothetical protein
MPPRVAVGTNDWRRISERLKPLAAEPKVRRGILEVGACLPLAGRLADPTPYSATYTLRYAFSRKGTKKPDAYEARRAPRGIADWASAHPRGHIGPEVMAGTQRGSLATYNAFEYEILEATDASPARRRAGTPFDAGRLPYASAVARCPVSVFFCVRAISIRGCLRSSTRVALFFS